MELEQKEIITAPVLQYAVSWSAGVNGASGAGKFTFQGRMHVQQNVEMLITSSDSKCESL